MGVLPYGRFCPVMKPRGVKVFRSQGVKNSKLRIWQIVTALKAWNSSFSTRDSDIVECRKWFQNLGRKLEIVIIKQTFFEDEF